MADYLKAHVRTGFSEGGWQANPNDRGNYCKSGQLVGTHRGLSTLYYEEVKGFCPTPAQLIAEANANVDKWFKWYFWDKVSGDGLSSQAVADALADWAFHKPAHVEDWMRRRGFWKNPAAVNRRPEAHLLSEIAIARHKYIDWRVNEQWRDGWERRFAAFAHPTYRLQDVPSAWVEKWRAIWARKEPETGIVSVAAWLAVPALAYFYGPRLWRMARRLIK